jgi:two-component system sensor histidine kinase HydH
VRTHVSIVHLARWGLIGAALLMGIALLATAWSTSEAVSAASATLIRGQGDVFKDSIRLQMIGLGRHPTGEDLASILEAESAQGLRYAALASDGVVIAEAGTPVSSRADLTRAMTAPGHDEPVAVEGRIRAVFRGPPGLRSGAASGERRLRRRGLAIVIEFEPQLAHSLGAASRRALGIGAIASGAFLVVAIGLVRWFWRREALERALERERRLAHLGEMSAVLAHEIRNPLASLKGNAQLLERTIGDDAKARAKAARVVDDAIRLETLSNNLLEFVRAGEIQITRIDPTLLLRDIVGSLDPDRIQVRAEGAPTSWRLDPDRMRQVLTNLLENALQAGGGEPVIASIAEQGGQLAFSVRDRGAGITADAAGRLFEPFFTTRTRGTGLGLAVAKRIVDLHRGRISGENAEGGGALFRVDIPKL